MLGCPASVFIKFSPSRLYSEGAEVTGKHQPSLSESFYSFPFAALESKNPHPKGQGIVKTKDYQPKKQMKNSDLVEAAWVDPYFLAAQSPCDERVFRAMLKADRKNFLPPSSQPQAYENKALPIGYAATCSQPSLVALMADLLMLHPGQKVMEVGTGCGYHAAITYELIKGGGGELTTVEIIPKLAEFGQSNLEKLLGYDADIEYLTGDGSEGIPGDFFDRIYFTGSVNVGTFNGKMLLEQLREPGILMFPELSTSSLRIIYKNKGQVAARSFPGIQFVGLQEKNK